MTASKGLKMPDGTICRKGVNCRRHGNLKRLVPISSPSATSVNPISKYSGEPFLKDEVRAYQSTETEYKTRSKKIYDFMNKLEIRSTLRNYTGVTFDYVNVLLRYNSYENYVAETNDSRDLFAGSKDDNTGEWDEEDLADSISRSKRTAQERIAGIDSALDKLPKMKKPQVFYRSVTPYENLATIKPGETFEDKAYTSLSEDPTTMIDLNRKQSNRIVLEVMTDRAKFTGPSQAKAWDFESDTDDFTNYFQNEKEHMLPRGSKFMVVGRRTATYEAPQHRKDIPYAHHKAELTVLQVIDITE